MKLQAVPHSWRCSAESSLAEALRRYLPEVIVSDSVRLRLSTVTDHWSFFLHGEVIPHWDGTKLKEYATTMFTVQIYLNDDSTDGKTRFCLDYKANKMPTESISYGTKPLNMDGCRPTHAVKPVTGSVQNNVQNDGGNEILHPRCRSV